MADETTESDTAASLDPTAKIHRSPTRRNLLAVLATQAISHDASSRTIAILGAEDDPILRLFHQFEAITAAHERALARVDRLEAELVDRIGYPRVALPTPPGDPARYAAETSSIGRHGLSGRQARRLKGDLRRRRRAWDAAAIDIGLAGATSHEVMVARAVRTIGSLLLATPATTLAGIRFKLIVLLALHQPGQGDAHVSPWRELRLILNDLVTRQA